MYHRKLLSGAWSTDTMDARCKSLDGNSYAQVFANKGYFAKVYPMDKKSKCGDALKLFVGNLGFLNPLLLMVQKNKLARTQNS